MGKPNKRNEKRKEEFRAKLVQQQLDDVEKARRRCMSRRRNPPSNEAVKAINDLKKIQDARDDVVQSNVVLHPPRSWNDNVSAHFQEQRNKLVKNVAECSRQPLELRSFPKENPKYEVIVKPKGGIQILMDTYTDDEKNMIGGGDHPEDPEIEKVKKEKTGDVDRSVQNTNVAIAEKLEIVAQDLWKKGSVEAAALMYAKLGEHHQRKNEHEAGLAFVKAAHCSKNQKQIIRFLNQATSLFVGIESFKLCARCAKEVAETCAEEKNFEQAILYLERAVVFYERVVAMVCGDPTLCAYALSYSNDCRRKISEYTKSLMEESSKDNFPDESQISKVGGKKWNSLFHLSQTEESYNEDNENEA